MMFRSRRERSVSPGFRIGRRFDNRSLVLPWPNMAHALVSGLTGSGKSVTCHNIIGELASCVDVAIVAVDLKRTDMTLWAPRLTTLAATPAQADGLLDELRRLIDVRTQTLVEFGALKWEPAFGPWLLIVIDEYAELSAVGTEGLRSDAGDTKALEAHFRAARTTRQVRLANVSSIARLGRAVGFTLVVATQYPTVEVLDQQVRTQLDIRLMHRVASAEQINVCLGSGRADSISTRSIPVSQPGGLWVVGTPDAPVPVRGRADFVSVDVIRGRAAATSHLRWPSGAVFAAESFAEEQF